MNIKIYRRPLACLSITGTRARVTPGLLSKFSGALAEKGINIYAVSTGEYSLSFYVDSGSAVKGMRALSKPVKKSAFTALSLGRNIAMLTATGKEFIGTPGMLLRLIRPLAKAQVDILSVTSSFDSVILFLNWKDGKKAFRLIERSFLQELRAPRRKRGKRKK